MFQQNFRLCVLFVVLSIAIRFGDCQNELCKNGKVKPGSEKTTLSPLEKILKPLDDAKNVLEGILGPRDKPKNGSRSSFSNVLDRFKDKVRLIAPGTRWCGDGDIARDVDDLGIFKETDTCCRAHDKCGNNIEAGQDDLNLKNNGLFTRSACACDTAFYNCLKAAYNIVAFKIGVTYFNVVRPQCFKCLCPTDDCQVTNGTECMDHCSRYQWKDNPNY